MKYLLPLFFCIQCVITNGQSVILPKYNAPWEQLLPNENYIPQGILTPPPFKVRTMAEWEEVQALMITWTGYTSVLTEIVKAAQKEANVIIVTNNKSTVYNALLNAGIDTSFHIQVEIVPFNSVWSRDYGPNSVYQNDVDSLILVDWIYNRARYRDDTVSSTIANLLNVPLYQTYQAPYDLVNTGGNFMTDGFGLGFASDLVLTENGPDNIFGASNHSRQGVDSIMRRFMGIQHYHIMPKLPDDGIHHIDMHMKLLDEETLLVGEYPDGQPDKAQIEKNLDSLINSIGTLNGNDFKIIRIPMPPYSNGTYPGNGTNRTYTNAVFVNSTVIIPTYETKYDTTALRIWKKALPRYNIVGVNCNSPITAGGAVHCITKEIGVPDPMLFYHLPYEGLLTKGDTSLPISVYVKHRSGMNKVIICYRSTSDTTLRIKELSLSSPNVYGTTLSFQKGDTVIYQIKGVSNSGKNRILPVSFTPENQFWKFWTLLPSALNELPQNSYSIFPNPVSDFLSIELEEKLIQGNTIAKLSDMQGNVLASKKLNYQNNLIDMEHFPNGVYLLELSSSLGHAIQKIIKQN